MSDVTEWTPLIMHRLTNDAPRFTQEWDDMIQECHISLWLKSEECEVVPALASAIINRRIIDHLRKRHLIPMKPSQKMPIFCSYNALKQEDKVASMGRNDPETPEYEYMRLFDGQMMEYAYRTVNGMLRTSGDSYTPWHVPAIKQRIREAMQCGEE